MPNTKRPPNSVRRVIILGSTGSIGTNTLNVIRHLNAIGEHRFEVVGLAARSNAALLARQAREFSVKDIALVETDHTGSVGASARQGQVLRDGPDSARRLVQDVPADLVVAAIVGSAGLPSVIAALRNRCDIALANKETLVAAGALVMPLARQVGARILPIDSEHSAVFQCLQTAGTAAAAAAANTTSNKRDHTTKSIAANRQSPPNIAGRAPHRETLCDATAVRRLVLTASGGPFRTWSAQRIHSASVSDALNHPTWKMGPKVTVDSASMANKGLELIEAHWLFGLGNDQLDVIVHPQSIVHSFVEFCDGSVIAQLSPPDMKLPIQYALTFPQRAPGCGPLLDWSELSQLDFEPPDEQRFPALRLARQAIERQGTTGAVFNAANEQAVTAFLDGRIAFGSIAELTGAAMEAIRPTPVTALADVLDADATAREYVKRHI